VRLSIIVPTRGRPSLARTLRSIEEQELVEGDQVLLVADGPCPSVWREYERRRQGKHRRLYRYYETPPTRYLGFFQRQYGMERAEGDYLLFMADDDCYLPGALAAVRAAATAHPGRILMFRMLAFGGRIWRDGEPRFVEGNVSDQIVALPNDPRRLGRWDDKTVYQGDYWFLRETVDRYPEGEAAIVWIDHLIAMFRDGYAGGPRSD
jgi:glycosyltransferase involved in cell wall biosynthesis